jgi:hypothetical protein
LSIEKIENRNKKKKETSLGINNHRQERSNVSTVIEKKSKTGVLV